MILLRPPWEWSWGGFFRVCFKFSKLSRSPVIKVTTIHTYRTAQGTKVTRKSQTRQYAACLVTIVTKAVVERSQAKVEACAQAVPETETKLATLLAERNTTVEAAKAQFENEKDNADGNGTNWHTLLFAEKKVIRDEAERYVSDSRTIAKKRLIDKGFKDPYREGGPQDILSANRSVEFAVSQLADARKLADTDTDVGNEDVLSWHLTVPNAKKALSNRDAARLRLEGYGVEVRFNRQILEGDLLKRLQAVGLDRMTFEVRETKPRKRASNSRS